MGSVGRHAVVVFACALVACGLNVVGSGDAPPMTEEPATPAKVKGADAGGVTTEVPIEGVSDAATPEADAAVDGASTPEAGATCLVDNTSCTTASAKECCSKGCNTVDKCHACSSSSSTVCTSQTQCCKGTFCGRENGYGYFHCLACAAGGDRCGGSQSGLTCCSGTCSYRYWSLLEGTVYACD